MDVREQMLLGSRRFKKICIAASVTLACFAPARSVCAQNPPTTARSSTGVFQYHNDLASTGQNLHETALTYANVNVARFAKQFATPVDGQIYAQPLYVPALVTTGAQAGTHDVVFVATEHDTLYAIDAAGGNVLWSTSFTDEKHPLINKLAAATITTVPSNETRSNDLVPEIGITSTPVIDPAAGVIYLIAKTKQAILPAEAEANREPVNHYVQTLYKVNIHSGEILTSEMFGDTIFDGKNYTYRYDDDLYVPGTGSGSVKNEKTGGVSRIYFDALREFGRCGLVLNGGKVTAGFASHGDNGPYHGWVLQFDAASLAVVSAFNASPNGSGAGIWQSGGSPAVDERGDLFLEVGNGTFDGNKDTTGLDEHGFPAKGNYGDCFLRLTNDTDHTTKTNPSVNGWGLKVADYFSPFNNHSLDRSDTDVGSGGVTLLPDALGTDEHPRLLIGAGKEGKIYLLDRNEMGKFDPATDHVVQTQGRTKNSGINASFGTPAYFNGSVYYFPGYGGDGRAFHIEDGAFTPQYTSHTKDNYGALIGTPTVSADPSNANGIVWMLDRGSNQLRAYRADDLNVRLWSSADAPEDRDRLGTVVKFSVPTVADGRVLVGTADHLVIYGPPTPPTSAPQPPSGVVADARAFNLVRVSWQDNSNNEDGFHVERSSDGSSWTVVATVSANEVTAVDSGTQAETAYRYRVTVFNNFNGNSSATSTGPAARVTTPAAPPLGTGDGLTGLYFNDKGREHFAGEPALTRVDPGVDFDWGEGSPGEKVGADHFSVRWTGKIQPHYSQRYTFYTDSDDGARLWIDGHLLIDDWTAHSPHEASATVSLSAGQKYDLRLEYYEDASTAEARLSWSSPSTQKQRVPKSQLYSGAAPAAPTELTVTAGSGTQANLTWKDNAANELGYIVERKTGDADSFTVAAKLPASTVSYLDTGLNPAEHYIYRVRATNFSGNSPASNEVSVVTPTPPLTPSGARVVDVSTSAIHLVWESKSTNEEGVRILRSTAGGTFVVIATLPPRSTAFTDDGKDHKGLPAGTEFDYHIQSFNIAGASDFTGAASATLTDAPMQLEVQRTPQGKVALKWKPPALEGSGTPLTYSVYRAKAGEDSPKTPIISGLSDPTFTDEKPLEGNEAEYSVSATNRGGESARSAAVKSTGG